MADGLIPGSLSYQLVVDRSREEGAREALSRAIIDLAKGRFPGLKITATQQMSEARSATLHLLLLRIGRASDLQDAYSWLLDFAEKEPHEEDDHNPLRESPLYQRILEEGRAQGRKEAHKSIYLLTLREAAVGIVETHFPVLKVLAMQQVADVKDPESLLQLIVKFRTASNAKEAAGMLLDLPTEVQEQ
jgi:hypothetical protein